MPDTRRLLSAPLVGALVGCLGIVDGTTEKPTPSGLEEDDDGGRRCYPSDNELNCSPPDYDKRCSPRVRNPATTASRADCDRNGDGSVDAGAIGWPVAGGTELLDGLGNWRGVVTEGSVKLNYGMRKRLHALGDAALVYAWAVRIDTNGDGAGDTTASGWIRQDALDQRDTLRNWMPTLALPNPGEGHYQTHWIVTGGDPAAYDGLSVNRSGLGAAADYLLRAGNVVNIVYNTPGRSLGGFSVDTFPPGVVFRRARGVRQIEVPLYDQAGHASGRFLNFAYGYVNDGTQRRYGWMAKEAMVADAGGAGAADPVEPDPADPQDPADPADPVDPGPVQGTCDVRCCDGSLSSFSTADADTCRNAYDVCAGAAGHVLRMRFDGALIYERAEECSFCCALCRNRERYHRVEGVTEGCTDAASDYCGVGDRGGLEDADWRDCEL